MENIIADELMISLGRKAPRPMSCASAFLMVWGRWLGFPLTGVSSNKLKADWLERLA